MIKDSGERREFESGAVRDIAEGKGRCDLLPLGVISDRLGDKIFTFIEEYIRQGNVTSLWFVLDEFIGIDDKQWYSVLLDVSKHYEVGAKKYDDRNWEKGIPLHCYIDSAVRHYLQWMRGDSNEPHDRAFVWNILGAIWTHINKPEMIDLPFKEGIGVKTSEENKKPYCFRPNNSAYPLCLGAENPQEFAENDCGHCCLYEDMEDEGGYSQYDK